MSYYWQHVVSTNVRCRLTKPRRCFARGGVLDLQRRGRLPRFEVHADGVDGLSASSRWLNGGSVLLRSKPTCFFMLLNHKPFGKILISAFKEVKQKTGGGFARYLWGPQSARAAALVGRTPGWLRPLHLGRCRKISTVHGRI